MSPEARRIAIAEACGWEWIKESDETPGLFWGQRKGRLFTEYTPDYLNDLNAMAEAERTLDASLAGLTNQQEQFESELCAICGGWRKAIHATASQRAEALLKTLGLLK